MEKHQYSAGGHRIKNNDCSPPTDFFSCSIKKILISMALLCQKLLLVGC